MKLFVGDVTAAMTGLEPVGGAKVELIRLDSEGNQDGPVLASTVTSSTGHYTLVLPTGVDLAGNLVVRITGSDVGEMRAQVVQEKVNISPVSEFILRKFIDEGTDLLMLKPTAVVKLSAHVEEYDLAASGDLSTLFEQLEASVGEFIESQIATLDIHEVDSTVLNGDYHNISMQIEVHDSDNNPYGSFGVKMVNVDLAFTGDPNGSVDIAYKNRRSGEGLLSGGSDDAFLKYTLKISNDTGSFPALFSHPNVLLIEREFEENIEGEWGWRWPPVTHRVQKVRDQNLFFQLPQEAAIRYATLDTNGDSINDAVNPDARSGDEIVRGLDVFFKRAKSGMATEDLDGAFGRVAINILMENDGYIEMEVSNNKLVFANGIMNYAPTYRNRLSRDINGRLEYDTELGISREMEIEVMDDGQLKIAGNLIDGYLNEEANFSVFGEVLSDEASGHEEVELGQTYFIKLPESAPDLTNKRYRLMFVTTGFAGTGVKVNNSRFNSFITWKNNKEGVADLEMSIISKIEFYSDIVPSTRSVKLDARAESVEGDATLISIADADGELRLRGYWSETASYGIFTAGFVPEGQESPVSLGLAYLIEVEK
ncbi:hypothetical protein [Saccharophagus sp. K07]|uniref:hypothetical protein n=1 Tax=Saccharophagus sp. K07 TaxID=2283636 RepID=UPI0016528C60|nr:hypothetical protein [Saccharophagus sp. K07]